LIVVIIVIIVLAVMIIAAVAEERLRIPYKEQHSHHFFSSLITV
jgi:hypothetical protein